MDDLERSLGRITLAPYIVKAMALIGVRRRGGSNMFRHQISTMAILLDYKILDPVILKAAVIHDLFEDARAMPGVTEEEITRIDSDGPAVYALVMEVTIRVIDGVQGAEVRVSAAHHADRQRPRHAVEAGRSHQQPHRAGIRARPGIRRDGTWRRRGPGFCPGRAR